MRSRTARRLAATLLLAGAALGFTAASPAGATPIACSGACSVTAFLGGYITPVTEITSGSTVSWSSLDTTHPTHEGDLGGESGSGCFSVTANPVSPTAPVAFNLAGDGSVSSSNGACTTAVVLPSIGTVVPYHCALHPNMIGLLLVSA